MVNPFLIDGSLSLGNGTIKTFVCLSSILLVVSLVYAVCSLNSTQRTQEFTADYKRGSISLHTHISSLSEHSKVLYLLLQMGQCPLHRWLLDIPVMLLFRIQIDSGEIENLQLQYIIVQKLYIYKSGILSQIYKGKN